MKNSECERFVCELKSMCRMAYLGSYFCAHYCQSAKCLLCQKMEECNLIYDDRKDKKDEFRTE